MADIDDALRSDDAPAPSPGFAASVLEAVRLERRAPPSIGPPRVALAVGFLSIFVLVAALALGSFAGWGHPLEEVQPGPAVSWVRAGVKWAVTSGSRMLMAALGLVAVILAVRHGERSV